MNNSFRIGLRQIGNGCPCFIIAEIGMNHDASKAKAKKLIEVASRAGVSAVKFQTFKATDIVSPKLPANYDPQEKVPKKYTYFYQYIEKYELPYEYYEELIDYAKKHNLIFLSTPCSFEAVDFLKRRIPAFKVASMDLNNIPLLEKIGKTKKPVILSTGIGKLSEIKTAIEVLYGNGTKEIAILHCVSNYPAKPKELNLRNITMLKNKFKLPVGFSDHSLGILSSVTAVALGACIIEKHITLSRNTLGPDHYFAIEPDELKDLVENIRQVESSLGSYERKLTEAEIQKKITYRRSIVTNSDLKKGRLLRREDVYVIRPGSGIKPADLSKIIGKALKKNITAYTPLKWEYLR